MAFRLEFMNPETRSGRLVRPLPPSDPNFVFPEIVFRRDSHSKVRASQTIVMPVFNAGSLGAQNLIASLNLLAQPADVVVIFDGCTDDSIAQFQLALASAQSDRQLNLINYIGLATNVEVFETASDNLGFMLADTDFIIELQSDIRLLERNWDERLLEPITRYDDIFCVSGRACHTWQLLQPKWWKRPYRANRQSLLRRLARILNKETRMDFEHNDPFGTIESWYDDSWDVPSIRATRPVYLKDTVNRGPIAFRRTYLSQLGYLDESAFFLGNDEHDLTLRAWSERGLRCCYRPIAVQSRPEWGAQRRGRTDATKQRMKELSRAKEARLHDSSLQRYLRSKAPVARPPEERRYIHAD